MSLKKTMEVHLIVNSNVFYILFATNKSISACIFHDTRSHYANRGQVGAYFHVRAFKNYIYRQHM